MPVYEYQCEKCGQVSEALRKMDDADAPMACEACGSRKTKRVHSVFAAGGGAGDVSLPMGGGCPCGDPNGPCGR